MNAKLVVVASQSHSVTLCHLLKRAIIATFLVVLLYVVVHNLDNYQSALLLHSRKKSTEHLPLGFWQNLEARGAINKIWTTLHHSIFV